MADIKNTDKDKAEKELPLVDEQVEEPVVDAGDPTPGGDGSAEGAVPGTFVDQGDLEAKQ